MVAKKSELLPEDETVEAVYKKYKFLKQEVEHWQQERSSYWTNMINLTEEAPFLPLAELPSDAVIELWQKLNVAAKFIVSDSELREIWQKLENKQNAMDEAMATRLQMAISGVAQIASKLATEKNVIPARQHQNTAICPVCGEICMLAVITPPDGHRIMHCTMCGFEWKVKRIKCLHCGSEDEKQQMYLKNKNFPGIEMVACQLCGQYVKEVDARDLQVKDYLWEDIRTLPLNFAVERWLAENGVNKDKIH